MATQYTAGLSSGQVLTSATMNSIGAESITYSPVWSAATAPAIGNGFLAGRYFQIQKIVFVEILFVAGSTSTYGTGTYKFSLPITARAGLFGFMSNGVARMYDASANQATFGQTGFLSSDVGNVYVYLAPTGQVGQTTPFTWATSDELIMTFQYEAA